MEEQERYEIIKLLGKGRTGGVYEADDTILKRKVALRRFFSDQRENDVSAWQDDFNNISQNLCNLQNPGLITVFDAGIDDDGAFMITQLVDGKNLSDRLAESHLEEWEAHDLASQLLDTLSSCHDAGFIHGALTPGSIMMVERARGGHRYIILDLGLCRLAPLIQGADSYLAMMADPALMAPELFNGSSATEKSDIYMLGQLIYTTLAGGHPFAGISLQEVGQKHANDELPPITDYRPDLSPAFVTWLESLTKPNPDERPETILEAAKSLPKVDRPKPKITGPITKRTSVKLNTGQVADRATASHNLNSLSQNLTPTEPAVSPLTQRVSLTTARPVSIPAQSSNKSLIITLSCVGAVIVAVIIGIIIAASGPETSSPKSAENSEKSDSSTTEKKSPKAKPTVEHTTLFNINTTEEKPSEALLDFTKKSVKDFAFITGTPVEDSIVFSDNGSVFQEITTSQGLRPTKKTQELRFKFKKQFFSPEVVLTSENDGGLLKNLGFIIEAESPSQPNGSFTLTTFVTTWNCDAKIRIRSNKLGVISESPIPTPKQTAPYQTFAVQTKITNFPEHETFLIEIIADKVTPTSTLSLNAIKCE